MVLLTNWTISDGAGNRTRVSKPSPVQ